MLERVDDWLATHEAESPAGTATLRLGVGVYAIHDTTTGEQR
jgi:hypothetical protein